MVLDPTKFIVPVGAPAGGQQATASAAIGPSDTAVNGQYSVNEQVLGGNSTVVQIPAGQDNPLQIEFGPAQGTIADPLMMDAAGLITCNESGVYDFSLRLLVVATMNNSLVHFRSMKNGVQFGDTFTLGLSRRDFPLPITNYSRAELMAGDTLYLEMVRDSSENDNGFLTPWSPSTPGWSTTPSASLDVFRYQQTGL